MGLSAWRTVRKPREPLGEGRARPSRGWAVAFVGAMIRRALFLVPAGLLLAAYVSTFSIISFGPNAPVSSDAGSIWEAAIQSHWFYDSGIREPFFPFLAGVVSLSGVSGVAAVRVVCALCTLATMIAIGVVGYRRSGPWTGLLAAGIWGFTPSLLHYSAQGDRLTLTAGLLFVYAYLLYESPPSRTRTVELAVTGALLPLLRSEMLLVVVLSTVCRIAACRAEPAEVRSVGLALAVALVVFLPYPLVNSLQSNQPFPGSALAARYWANREFYGPQGLHLTFAEVLAEPYRGGPLSPIHYVFGMHSLPEVANRIVSGYWRLFTFYLPRFALPVFPLWILAVAGLSLRLRREGASAIPFILLAHFPFVFVYTLDQIAPGSGIEARFSLFTTPFLALWAAEPLVIAARFGLKRLPRTREEGSTRSG